MYICQRRNPIKQAPFDFFSKCLMSIVSHVKILLGYRTDHSLLFLELQFDDFKKENSVGRF